MRKRFSYTLKSNCQRPYCLVSNFESLPHFLSIILARIPISATKDENYLSICLNTDKTTGIFSWLRNLIGSIWNLGKDIQLLSERKCIISSLCMISTVYPVYMNAFDGSWSSKYHPISKYFWTISHNEFVDRQTV